MKKVLFIDHEPFCKRRDQLFHISHLMNDGFSVEVWDLSSFYNSGRNLPEKIEADYVKIFYSQEEVRKAISTIDAPNTFVLIELHICDSNFWLFQELHRHHCYTARFDFYSNILPTYHIDLESVPLFSKEYFLKVKKKIENYIKWRLFQFKWRHIKYDCHLSPCSGNTITGRINHPDYNDYRFHLGDPLFSHPYYVFCDVFFPLHPDAIETTKHLDPQKYYAIMRRYFDYLEAKTSIPVVIAAHPKAQYIGNEFGNRPIIKYQTNNLVIHSEGVITHQSNSVAYAILADRKIVCVTTNDYDSIEGLRSYLRVIGTYFQIPVYNIEEENLDHVKFRNIDHTIRENYIYSFLTSKESENTENYEIIKKAILNAKK